MKNLKATLAYRGTRYFGWQKTKEGISIEESLEAAFGRILQERVTLQAASRTDRGVHAYGQVINLFSTQEELDLPAVKKGVQAVLPWDISLLSLELAPLDFHPTLHSHSKEYLYILCNSPFQLPFYRELSWHCPYLLNLELMEKAARILEGEHDFAAFTNQGNDPPKDTIRTLYTLTLTPLPEKRLQFSLVGNRFLYKMARNLVGTLVSIGRGKISLDALPMILEGKDRTMAGMTAPAHGLFLNKVFYT